MSDELDGACCRRRLRSQLCRASHDRREAEVSEGRDERVDRARVEPGEVDRRGDRTKQRGDAGVDGAAADDAHIGRAIGERPDPGECLTQRLAQPLLRDRQRELRARDLRPPLAGQASRRRSSPRSA